LLAKYAQNTGVVIREAKWRWGRGISAAEGQVYCAATGSVNKTWEERSNTRMKSALFRLKED